MGVSPVYSSDDVTGSGSGIDTPGVSPVTGVTTGPGVVTGSGSVTGSDTGSVVVGKLVTAVGSFPQLPCKILIINVEILLYNMLLLVSLLNFDSSVPPSQEYISHK